MTLILILVFWRTHNTENTLYLFTPPLFSFCPPTYPPDHFTKTVPLNHLISTAQLVNRIQSSIDQNKMGQKACLGYEIRYKFSTHLNMTPLHQSNFLLRLYSLHIMENESLTFSVPTFLHECILHLGIFTY